MMKRILLFLFFSLLFCKFSNAENTLSYSFDDDKKKKDKGYLVDTAYIQLYKTKFGIKPRIATRNRLFNFGNGADYFKQNSYLPLVGGLTITIFDFDLSFAINKTKVITNSDGKQETQYKDLSFNYYNNNFIFEFYYKTYTGMYNRFEFNDNSGNHFKSRAFDSTLVETAIGVNTNIVPNNKRFSYKAAFYNSAIQKKTAGSFIMCLSLRSITLESKKTGKYIIPKLKDETYGSLQGLYKYKQEALIFPKAGYAFNLVKKKFYFAPAAMASVWRSSQTFYTESKVGAADSTGLFKYTNKVTKLNAWMFESSVNVLTGINFKRWYYGLYANLDYNITSNKYFQIARSSYAYGFFMGFHIIKHKYPKKKKICCLY